MSLTVVGIYLVIGVAFATVAARRGLILRRPPLLFAFLVVTWPISLLVVWTTIRDAPHPARNEYTPEIPQSWLRQQYTPDTPGFATSEECNWPTWQRLAAMMRLWDELWYFMSPRETWEKMAGRAGYVTIRAGRQVHVEVTVMN